MTVQAYPLAWPAGFARTTLREKSRFKTTLSSALDNVRRSLALFGRDSGKAVRGVVISSNYSLGNERPTEPGVAVYFTWDGMNVCIPVDRYVSIAENLQAIHHIVEARRVELRHGTLSLIRATFAGFSALPAPGAHDWRAVLGVEASSTLEAAELAYRTRARATHPDNGGSHDAMARLNTAIAQARAELGRAAR
jgi:hypothetical protein